jgi:hypothetical protein
MTVVAQLMVPEHTAMTLALAYSPARWARDCTARRLRNFDRKLRPGGTG